MTVPVLTVKERSAPLDGDEPVEVCTWEPIDLTAAVGGDDLPPPSLMARTDGVCLLYAGRVHWFMGESESCKSWALLHAAASVLCAGGRVLWVDYEDDDRGVVARLKALLVSAEVILERFVYVRPEEPLLDRQGRATDGNAALGRLLAGEPFELAVIDGVTEAMVTEGLDLLDNADIASWMRRLPKRIAQTGAAVACIDHLPKAKDQHGRFAIGGQHKLAGVTGAAYRFEVLQPFARPSGAESSQGIVAVVVTKDRPGHVRGHAGNGRVALMRLTGYPDGSVHVGLDRPDAEPPPDLALCGRILGYLADYDGASKNRIETDVEGKAAAIRDALRWMAAPERGWVRIEKRGQSHLHWLTDAGREEL